MLLWHVLTAATAIASSSAPVCTSWRQTGRCAADGPREPSADRPCDAGVEFGLSGYCECAPGTVVGGVGCRHAALTCDGVCGVPPAR